MLRHKDVTRIGKIVRHASRLRGGSGSALPGLIVEKVDPVFAQRVLSALPQGVIIITGTNGKTTTTKIVCQLLESTGLKVFTNRTGSNFTRGIIAALLAEVDTHGTLDADIAVLELDEAYAAKFVSQVQPRYSLLLNVMRDQLDRFGEIDHTASLLRRVAAATTETVVLNSDDPLVSAIATELSEKNVLFYGLNPSLHSLFPDDSQLYGTTTTIPRRKKHENYITLDSVNNTRASFQLTTHKPVTVDLKLQGIYNMQNAAGALALASAVTSQDFPKLVSALKDVRPAFGRGEAVMIDGKPLEIILVKNPAGFRLALKSYTDKPADTMIAINDNYADGRDMSWLWDVTFTDLKSVSVVSGSRAYDMALRLQYDDVIVGHVDTSLAKALSQFLSGTRGAKRIYCTYTAMMTLRKLLAKTHALEDIDR